MMKLIFRAAIMTAAVVIASLALVSAGRTQTGGDQMKLPRETLAADSEDDFNKGNQFLHSGSAQTDMQQATDGLEKLGAGGHLVVLDAGTQVKMMGGGTRVRIVDGPHAGQVWWLFTDEDVRKPGDVPPGSFEER
jgi:hypothetical protein